jgi:prepilin-type N-terminal cleavage/methylation domain-containing protein
VKDGFSLMEVLVATLILSLGVVTLVQLSSQGLRLLKVSDDQQQAALLADRLLRAPEPAAEGVQSGQEGAMSWERRVDRRETPEALLPPGGPAPALRVLTVTVRWGAGRSLEAASLRLTPLVPDPSHATETSRTPRAGRASDAGRSTGAAASGGAPMGSRMLPGAGR